MNTILYRWSLFLIVISLFFPWGCQTEPTIAAEELTIGFWNVENLLDEFDDPLLEFDEKGSSSAVRDRIGKDAEVIRALNADILGLAEVENLPLLKRLAAGYLSRENYQHIILLEGADPRGIDVALLSRIPCLVQTIPIEGLPRDILAARFVWKQQVFYVLVNHWKSRLENGGEDIRQNGATAVVNFIKKSIYDYEGKSVPVIVLGDFNDGPDDLSIKTMAQQGLTNTMLSVSEDKRWTHGHYNRDDNRMELYCFDQLLISPELLDKKGLEWIKTDVRRPPFMVNDRRSFNGVKIPLPIDDYQDRIGYSDHYPVLGTFRLVP